MGSIFVVSSIPFASAVKGMDDVELLLYLNDKNITTITNNPRSKKIE